MNGNEKKPTKESTTSSTVREFIYLDLPKLFSYLSQIQGGRQLLIQRVQKQFRVDETSEPTYSEGVKFEVDAALSGKVPFIAEGNLHGAYNQEETATSGDVRLKTGRIGERATISAVHHEALKLVQDHLGGSFVTLHGHLEIIDFAHMIKFIEDYPKFVENFNKVTKAEMEGLENAQELGYLLYTASRNRLLVLLRSQSGAISTSYLSRDNMTSELQNIIDNYGVRPRVKFTLIGLDTTLSGLKHDFSENFNQDHEDGKDMGKSLVSSVQQLGTLLGFWQLRSKESHVFPLAIYRDL